MKPMRKLLLLLCAVATLSSCGERMRTAETQIVVSIEPLRAIVEGIVGDDFEVVTLVPPGASPETYEPTPEQMERVERSQMVFAVGLIGFEHSTVERLTESAAVRYVNLSEGIDLLDGHCHHDHAEEHHHAEGANPHLWTSPRQLRQMAATAYAAIAAEWPDSTVYKANYEAFITRLDSLDGRIIRRLSEVTSRAFVIYHPTFGYLAEEYGLTEIAIESHGKEPSADHLRHVVDEARAKGVSKVFYQREFPRSVVETVARELDVEPIEVDILSGDVEGMIYGFVDKLAR